MLLKDLQVPNFLLSELAFASLYLFIIPILEFFNHFITLSLERFNGSWDVLLDDETKVIKLNSKNSINEYLIDIIILLYKYTNIFMN